MIELRTSNENSSTATTSDTSDIVGKTGLFSFAEEAVSLAMKALGLSEPGRSPKKDYPVITLDQVSWHDNIGDCWIVLYDKVYNITSFLHEHPGGVEILLEHAGRDATLAFRDVRHGPSVLQSLEPNMVGVLPEDERIFSGGKLVGLTLVAAC